MTIQIAKKKTLSSIAYEYIKKSILSGEIRDGDLISENRLADALNMSRTPVKRALTQLESENYVRCIDGIGTIVVGLSINDLVDIYEVRKVLESLALETAINRIRTEDIEEVQELIEDALHCFSGSSEPCIDTMTAIDNKVHSLIINSTSNTYVKELMYNIQSQIERYKYKAYAETKTGYEGTIQHIKILHYIKLGQLDKAKTELENHIQWSFDELKIVL